MAFVSASTNRNADRLSRRLADVVGSDGVVSDPERLLVYESDGLTAYRFPPRAIVFPASTEQVSSVARVLAEEEVPFVPRGAGTGLSGGALAVDRAVLVGTSRMNRILEIDPPNRRAVVQPGVINARLSRAARPHGLYYAPDPSSQSACTIGGNVAENSGGPHCLKYGVTSRYVTGLEVVLADGEVVRLGGTARGATDPDLVGLFVGSEGCLGIATEIEVELLPLPQGVRTILGIFETLEDSGRAVNRIMAEGLLPAALEIIDGETIRAVEESVFAAGYPTDAGAALVVEFDGIEEALESQVETAVRCCEEAGAREVRRATSEEERLALWRGRKKAFGAMGRIAPDLMVQDATVPRTRLPDVLARISEIGERYGLNVANVFHAGDGNLHPNLLFDRTDAEEVRRVEAASKEIMRTCVEAGGTITGEHGVGVDKRDYMPLIHSSETLEAMARIRSVFDPAAILNPGKVLPDEFWPPPREAARPARGGPATPRGRALAEGGARTEAPATPSARRSSSVSAALSERLRTLPLAEEVERKRWPVGDVVPGAVAFPRTEEELAEVLGHASEEGWSVVPAGRGAWMAGGGPVTRADVVVSSRDLEKVVEYVPDDWTLTAQAGLTLGALEDVTREQGQWLAQDPPGWRGASLGAFVSTGLSGPLAAGYGRPRDHLLGLTAVTGDGRIIRPGGKVVKNVAGFDLVRLLAGSWGTLGVITDVTLRLYPRPHRDVTLLFEPEAGDDALSRSVDIARAVATSEVVPEALELFWPPPDGEAPTTSGATGRRRRSGGGPSVAVRAQGGETEVRVKAAVFRAAADAEPVVLEGEESRSFFRGLSETSAGSAVSLHITFPPSGLGEVLEAVGELRASGAAAGCPVWATSSVTRGTTRLELGRPPRTESADWSAALEHLRRRVDRLEGFVTILRSPTGDVEALSIFDSDGESDVRRRLTRGIERALDPAGVLVPGRRRSGATAPEEAGDGGG